MRILITGKSADFRKALSEHLREGLAAAVLAAQKTEIGRAHV